MSTPAERVRPLIAGRYRVEEPIGAGGMAQVWRATDVRLARAVAVKLLTVTGESETDEQVVRRFLREARLAAAVRHPNVVSVLDFGTTEENRPFMVLELMRGESLEARLARTPPITLTELIDVAAAVLAGLEAVHKAGIVHRDLKPDNVFLAEEGESVRPKLLDFGVSRGRAEEGRRSVLTTIDGRLVGTPEYMSPEQARGLRDVDLRTDLYGVGVVLYEAITGRLPYHGEGLGDLIIAIASGGALPVSELRPEAGAAISGVIAKAMSVAREDRYASAREMREALLGAAAESLGQDARASLPGLTIERHAERTSSRIVTMDARPANGTPHVWTVDVALPRKRRSRAPWIAAAAVALASAPLAYLLWPASAEEAPLPLAATEAPPAPAPAAASQPPPVPLDSSVAQPPELPSAAPIEEVALTLRGLPRGARVLVDGAEVEHDAGVVLLARDGRERRVEVRLGARSWAARHVADADAALVVRLRGAPRRPAAAEQREPIFRELDY